MLEDRDKDDADLDIKTLGAVCEEPAITIGLVVGTLADSEADDELHEEESYIDDDNGGFSEPDLVREALEDTDGYLPRLTCVVGSLLLSVVLTLRSRRGRLTQMKKRHCIQTSTSGWRWRVEESAYFFASTTAQEAVKFPMSEALSKRVSRDSRPLKYSINDI